MERGSYQKLGDGEVIHIHPYRTPPVIFCSAIKLVLFAQTPKSKVTPQLFFITDQVKNMAQLFTLRIKKACEEREERDIAFMADEGVLFEVVDCGVTVAFFLLAPVQVIDVAQDSSLDCG